MVSHSRFVGALLVLATSAPALAQGHGPAFGLSTPTLGEGGWSVDVAAMSRIVDDREMLMLRPMVSYGITEDLQISASFPMPLYVPQGAPPAHGMSRMPTTPDVEFLLGWRFHRQGTDIGSRFESTTYVGFDYPTDAVRAGVRTSPGLYGARVTGYASRTVYVWAGGLYRRYMSPVGDSADHLGDVAMNARTYSGSSASQSSAGSMKGAPLARNLLLHRQGDVEQHNRCHLQDHARDQRADPAFKYRACREE